MRRGVLFLVVMLALLLEACGDGASDVSTTQPPPQTSVETGVTTLAGSSSSLADEGSAVSVLLDVPYSSGFTLDVYSPAWDGEWAVAVVFHGGEVVKASMADYATQVAERGVVVFVPEFSSTPAQLAEGLDLGAEDGVCAMRYARSHAGEFGGNGDRVVAAGLSYGAIVAALMNLAADRFAGDCFEADDVSGFADGLVGLDGFYDFAELPEVLGFQDRNTVEELEMASATTYVTAPPRDGVRFQLFTGNNTVAQDQAELFRALLDGVGYQVEVHARPDVPHTVMFPTQAEGAVQALVDMASGRG